MSDDDNFAGLPSVPMAGGAPASRSTETVAWVEYRLPADMISPKREGQPDRFMDAGFAKTDLVFRMRDITPNMQDRCAKIAGNNGSALSRELTFAALYQIGDWDPQRNRDKLEAWWVAIGGKGRRLVESAFMAMQSVAEADVDRFLAGGTPGAS